jgi:tyrosine-protein phosphatase YwqE
MFDFLKRKRSLPTFAPLVTDMHCHLLPQVDDGSKSLEESLEVMEVMKECGFEEIRLTPHFNYPRFPNKAEDIKERYKNFCAEVEANKGERELPRMTSVTGEFQVSDGFNDYLESGQLLTYKFANPKKCSEKGLLLIEFSLHQKRMGLEDTVFKLQMEGYDIILAHPERYPYFDAHSSLLEQFKEQGVYFQVNILSLDGFYGEASNRKAYEYIENGWVEFLGTDMHNVMYAQALRHASTNKKIIKLLEKTEFENKNLVQNK